MPRPRRDQNPGPNAVVASAARVQAGKRRGIPTGQAGGWQAEAWAMLDAVGELEFFREWMSNALSRCTLRVVETVLAEDGTPAVREATDPSALAALEALFDGDAGQGEMLATMAGHIAIPGETWLCGLLAPSEDPDGPDQWRVLSADEVKQVGNRWQIDRGDGEPEAYDDGEVYLTRIWRPHPRKWVEAHSSVRSALPILRELLGLSKHTAAAIDSRLAGAGLLVVPTEITFASPANPDADGTDPDDDPFLAALTEAMLTAIEDRGDASAIVPIVVRVPAEHADKIKHLSFATAFDAKAADLRKEALTRLASALDVPAEVLTGMADVNHWTGWLLDENAIKMHVEPTLAVITHGLTTRYLWPVLQGDAERFDPALRRFRIIGDTSALRQRPNRSQEARDLHSGLLITDAALLRETGLDSADLLDPTSDEFRRRLLLRIAGGTTTPDLTAAALESLGVPLDVPVSPAPPAGETGPAPTGEEVAPPAIDARRDLPQQEQAAALLAVSEALSARAVERAWNKAGRRGRVRGPVSAEALDAALAGAWDYAPRAAALCGVDAERLTACLDEYARVLLATGSDHDPATLATMLVSRVLPSHQAVGV